MKKINLKTKAALAVVAGAIAFVASAQVFSGSQPGYPLMGPASMFDASHLVNLTGNAAALTNFTQLTVVRGSLGLANATATTVSGACSLQVTVVMTNAVQGWLTNITSGQAALCGGVGGSMTGTNLEVLTLLGCKAGDSVEFTQMVGSTGIGLINSWTNSLQ